jgi:hypothetical protein
VPEPPRQMVIPIPVVNIIKKLDISCGCDHSRTQLPLARYLLAAIHLGMRILAPGDSLDLCVWHKARPLLPVRTVEGGLRCFEVWRRWNGVNWEYSERPEERGEWIPETTAFRSFSFF